MSKTRYWITIFFILIGILLIGVKLTDRDTAKSKTINTIASSYKSDHIDTIIFSPEGAINYRLIAQQVGFYPEKGISWFTQPIMISFDINKIPIWSIKSDMAKLTNNRMLYLYGHVEINLLSKIALFHKAMTDSAQINLVTQEVTSQDLVALYGSTFNSSGFGMCGNLRSKRIMLIEKVKTAYEFRNK